MVKLAEKLLLQKTVKLAEKFVVAKIGKVSTKFAAAKLFVANSLRLSLDGRSIIFLSIQPMV